MKVITSFCLLSIAASVNAAPLSSSKVDCLSYLNTDSPSIFIKVNKKERLNQEVIERIQDYDIRDTLLSELEEQEYDIKMHGYDFDIDSIERRLNNDDTSITDVEKSLGESIIKSLYDVTPSSSDNDSPFGIIALGNSQGDISDTCSAQMAPLSVDEITGDLYANSNNSKVLIAKPINKLPNPNDLDDLLGNYHEYKLIDGISISKASFKVKGKRDYSYKSMTLRLKSDNSKKDLTLKSFKE